MQLIEKYLSEKRGQWVYVVVDGLSHDVISVTDNINKLQEIVSNATGQHWGIESLNKVQISGRDYFGKGKEKVNVFKTMMI
jgi:hypothetical protein